MNGKHDKSVEQLRGRAEELLQTHSGSLPKSPAALSHEEALKLIHELRVHQIELKMQNNELCRAQAELNVARERYFDLYNLAPVGYFIVADDGRILETNLAGVNLLGVPRAAMVRQPITRFIFNEDQDVYYLHRRKLLATGKVSSCELRMVKADKTVFWVRLTATTPAVPERSGACSTPTSRVVLSDISEQKQMEQEKAALDVQLRQAKRRPRVGAKAGLGKEGKRAGQRRR
jgi:PAS domain S-box-containing protein